MQRGWLHGLNFYLHRDITEWTPAIKGSVIVVTSQLNFEELKRNAEIIRVISDFSAEANILEVRSLSRNLPDSGQPQ